MGWAAVPRTSARYPGQAEPARHDCRPTLQAARLSLQPRIVQTRCCRSQQYQGGQLHSDTTTLRNTAHPTPTSQASHEQPTDQSHQHSKHCAAAPYQPCPHQDGIVGGGTSCSPRSTQAASGMMPSPPARPHWPRSMAAADPSSRTLAQSPRPIRHDAAPPSQVNPPPLHHSDSTTSIHSSLSFHCDTASPSQPVPSHSVWFTPSSPYPRMLLLLLALCLLFTFGFCLASRLSCALGSFVIGRLKPGAEPRALAALAAVEALLIPANFIAVFIFYFAKAQPGTEHSEVDLTLPSGWLQLAKQLFASAASAITARCHALSRKAASPPGCVINEAPAQDVALLTLLLMLRSIPRLALLALTTVFCFLFTASTPTGMWLRNGLLESLSTLATLLPAYLHNGFNLPVFYTDSLPAFMYRVLGDDWVGLLSACAVIANTTRTMLLLPVWYRKVPYRQQLGVDGTPLPRPTLDAPCEQCTDEQQRTAAPDDKHLPHTADYEVGCATTRDATSSSVSPMLLPHPSPPVLRCLSLAETDSPFPSPRSVLSGDDDDSASIASDNWQLDDMPPATHEGAAQLSECGSFVSLSASASFSSSTTVAAAPSGSRSVLWMFLFLCGVLWYSFLFISAGGYKLAATRALLPFIANTTYWCNNNPLLVLCLCFGALFLFLAVDYLRHIRHADHQLHADTAHGCGCRTPYLVLLCLLLSLDVTYYLVLSPFSVLLANSYLSLDSSLSTRAWTVVSFYALMLVWQLLVRYVAMQALPRGSSLAVLFPIQLIEDLWADLIFTSFTPFSLSFFVISTLHLLKTFIRDFDLIPSLLLYLPTLLSRAPCSLRALLTQSSSWRLAFPRRVLRHQNLVTELCAKCVVIAALSGDLVGVGVLGPPLILLDPRMPFNGVSGERQQHERVMIIAALLFLVAQQCMVHALVLRALVNIEAMSVANCTMEHEQVDAAGVEDGEEENADCDVSSPGLASLASPSFDDKCHAPYHAALEQHPPSPLPRSPSTSSAASSPASHSAAHSRDWSDGSAWLDRHWRFHVLFFVCCIVRLVPVLLSMISVNLHAVYFDNHMMCTYIPWMNAIGWQGTV